MPTENIKLVIKDSICKMIGVSTACLYPLETEKAFEYLAKNGIKNTEIFFNTDSELTPSFVSELKHIALANGVRVYSVHPFMSTSDYYYLFCEYPRRQADALDKYRRFFEIAALLGAEVVNFHGPRREQTVTPEKYCEVYTQYYREARKEGVYFCQENVSRCHSRSSEFIRYMSEKCGDDVRFTLDIKQAHRASFDPFDFIDATKGKLKLVHCNDFDESSDCLLPLCGTFDLSLFRRQLSENGYDGMFTIEVYSQNYSDRSEIIDSYKKLSRLFERK